jgi:hypothetical protein
MHSAWAATQETDDTAAQREHHEDEARAEKRSDQRYE